MRVRPFAALLTATLVGAALAAAPATAAPATSRLPATAVDAGPAPAAAAGVGTDDDVADNEAQALPPPALSGLGAGYAGSLLLSGPATQAYRQIPGVPVPRSAKPVPKALDGQPTYVPAKTCSAQSAKPGALALRSLLTRTYPGSGDYGIVASCVGRTYTSEHMEGRAFDWRVSIRVPRQKAQAETFLAWLTGGTGGNAGGNARRLGVMYAIWDGKIWGAYAPERGWRAQSCSGETGCHRDHVHLSLTWNGAYQRTSFWTGKAVGGQDHGPCVRNGTYFAPVGNPRVPNRTPCPTWRPLPAADKIFGTIRANVRRTVSVREVGGAVAAVQWILGGEPASGRSTALTGQHLAAFQLRRGLKRTGTITPQTWRSLASYASDGAVRIP